MSKLFQRLVSQTTAHQANDKIALIQDDEKITYHDFMDQSRALASSLSKQGIVAGQRVATIFSNQKEALISLYAIRLLGAVVVPINIQMPPEDILYVLNHAGCALILTDATIAQKLSPTGSLDALAMLPFSILIANLDAGSTLPSFNKAITEGESTFNPEPQVCSDNPNLHIMMYTSGTTGKPKGVMLSEDNLLTNMAGFGQVIDFTKDDNALMALPLFHAYGLIIGLYALDSSSTLVLVPSFSPKKIIENLVTHHVSILPLVPTMFRVLLKGLEKIEPAALSNMRYCISGGASLPEAILRAVESQLDILVLEGYGLTETSPVLAVNNPKIGSIAGSVGKPLPNIEMVLLDESQNQIQATIGIVSKEGEIAVKGPNIMAGYFQNPEETNNAFSKEGYFLTGDLGHFDAEGNLFISGGRKKDLIIKDGENISPLRIEETLYHHPAIAEASVIGVPDERHGEEIMACVTLHEGHTATEQDIRKYCQTEIGPMLSPKYVRFYDELPKNPTGKILKKVLRAEHSATPVTST